MVDNITKHDKTNHSSVKLKFIKCKNDYNRIIDPGFG